MIIIVFRTFIVFFKNLLLYIINYTNQVDTCRNILTELSQLNIFYVKMIQWLMESNIRDKSLLEHVRSFTNNVEYSSKDIDYVSLLNLYSISRKNGDTFILDSLTPINSGTIALVFKGNLNGKEVVVKMLRVGIKKKLIESVYLMKCFCKIITFIPYLSVLNATNIINKNTEILINQSNFVNEVKNILEFNKASKNYKNLKVPFVYKKYTKQNNNIIIMEYLDGKTLYQLTDNEKDNYNKVFLNCLLSCMYNDNLLHGDQHPGNFIFLPNDVVGLIDFGIIYKLNIEMQEQIYDFFVNYCNGNFEKMIEHILKKETIHIWLNVNNNENYIKQKTHIKEEILTMINKNQIFINNIITHADIFNIIKILNKHNFDINNNAGNILLSVITFLNLTTQLSRGKKEIALESTKAAYKQLQSSLTFEF